MNVAAEIKQQNSHVVEHFDVLIVGAGISGIDAAYHLQRDCPDKSFVLLETQDTFGGTWATHKYPGIRSDSDLFTFGYGWKPWKGPYQFRPRLEEHPEYDVPLSLSVVILPIFRKISIRPQPPRSHDRWPSEIIPENNRISKEWPDISWYNM